MDNIKEIADQMSQATHWMPFAALFAREAVPANRPMTTRLVEQAFVAVIAGGGSAYGVNNAVQAKQEAEIKALNAMQAVQIKALNDAIRDSEIRLTAQIVELRARQLK